MNPVKRPAPLWLEQHQRIRDVARGGGRAESPPYCAVSEEVPRPGMVDSGKHRAGNRPRCRAPSCRCAGELATTLIRRFGSERDYSLCGVTHTSATARVVAALGQYLTAPTQPWDALICTSTAVRGAVERILDHHADYLERRRSPSTGSGWIHSPVRLPVIPLGVDCGRLKSGSAGSGSGSRRELRARLRIAEEDVAVLFVGRLSFHAKAHPTPMFLAAQRAARRVPGRRVHLLLAGQFSNKRIEAELRAAATQF